jgi:fibronectin-binding autotransporter adhesin
MGQICSGEELVMAIFQTSGTIFSVSGTKFDSDNYLTWDANAGTGGQTDGAGVWKNANQWWTGTTNSTWYSGAVARFGNSGTGGAVTLASPTAVNRFILRSYIGTYTLGTASQAITLANGISKTNNSAGACTIISPITVSNAQSWINDSAGLLTVGVVTTGAIDNGGNLLTIGGNGTSGVKLNGVLSGAGGLTKTGSCYLTIGDATAPVHTYTGVTSILGGILMPSANLPNGNLVINGGQLENYWSDGFVRPLGSSNGQVQLPGGNSGFSLNGNTGWTVRINNDANTELVWGSTYFNPSTLVLQSSRSQGTSGLIIDNKIDLSGANRTIQVNSGVAGTATATLSQIIRNSTGTAGIIKTGAGALILSGVNTFNGGVEIQEGIIRVANTATSAFGAAGNTITFSGNSTINVTGGTLSIAQNIAVNAGITATILISSTGLLTTGVVSGAGTYFISGNGNGTWGSTSNTHSGAIIMNPAASSCTFNFASMADAGSIEARGTTGVTVLNYTGGVAPLVWNTRQISLTTGTTNSVSFNNSSTGTNTWTIGTNISSSNAGAKSIVFTGGVITGYNVFSGNITDGSGSIAISKNGASNWALSGTNTYSGTTTNTFTNPAGILAFRGMQALSPNTNISENHAGGVGGFAAFYLLDNSPTPVDRSTVNFNIITSNTLHQMVLYVDRVDGSNTGSTITVGNINVFQGASSNSNSGITLSGANSYKLKVKNVNLPATLAGTGGYIVKLICNTSPLIVAGTVQQTAGSAAGSMLLQLEGTAVGNQILGALKDSADISPRPLSLQTISTGTWTLYGLNTFSGNTIVNGNGGTLRIMKSLSSPGTVTVTLGTLEGPNTDGTVASIYDTTVANSTNALIRPGAFGNNVLNTGTLTFSGINSRLVIDSTTNTMSKINAAGNVALGGMRIVFNAGVTANGTYKIITCSGTMSGTVNDTPIINSTGKTIRIQKTGNDLEAVVSNPI